MTQEVSTLKPEFLESRLSELAKVLPSRQAAESFARICLTAINGSPAIRGCTKASILRCVFDLATINLAPNTPLGHAFLIPYGGELTVQIGYRGWCELCQRTGHVKTIQADVVREGDEFQFQKGKELVVIHSPSLGAKEKRPVLGAYAYISLLNGGENAEWMDADELKRIEVLGKNSPAWKNFGDEMRKKCPLKRMLKVMQIGNSPNVARAIEIENQPFREPEITPEKPLLTFED
jgi:recombination protein RecT